MSVGQKRLRFLNSFAASRSELISARQRLAAPLQRLQWLVGFANLVSQESRHHTIRQERARWNAEIMAFGSYSEQPQPPPVSRRTYIFKELNPEQILSLARDVKTGLETRVRRKMWMFSVSERVTFCLGPQDTGSASFYAGECRDVLKLAARDLLANDGHRIQKCEGPDCELLLVRRKRGAYCSKYCSQRARTLRYRQSHPEEVLRERRHTQYVSTVRREKGPNVIVRRNLPVVPRKTERSDDR